MTISRTKRIIALETRADRYEQQADECRWEAAQLIVEELDSGKSQRGLGREIDKSDRHVAYMAWVWREHGANHGSHSFDSLYQKAKAPNKTAPTKKRSTGTTQSRSQKRSGVKAQPKTGGGLGSAVGRPSADELAVESRDALRQVDPVKLSELGWKYLDQTQERLSAIYDAGEQVRNG